MLTTIRNTPNCNECALFLKFKHNEKEIYIPRLVLFLTNEIRTIVVK